MRIPPTGAPFGVETPEIVELDFAGAICVLGGGWVAGDAPGVEGVEGVAGVKRVEGMEGDGDGGITRGGFCGNPELVGGKNPASRNVFSASSCLFF